MKNKYLKLKKKKTKTKTKTKKIFCWTFFTRICMD